MQQILKDVQDGTYAKNWIAENDKGRPWFNATRDAERNGQIEQVGAKLRALMPFLKPVATDETVGAR
jgi:ketol-acid reductoisomerase